MADDRKVLTAEELDAMTPDQRAAAFDERIVRDLEDLPDAFRVRVIATGQRLAAELRSSHAG